ncbi:MAG: tripartite tricarboxylate transporter permease [Rhodobacteraceae bacterium]|nr:tripartite tricarboxylate transporter permease [Paracoccaceae bacterium]
MGIPGSVIAAILAAGFTMHGIVPGPMVMRDNPDFMLGLFGSLLIASPLMLAFGLVGYFLKKFEFPFVTFVIGFIIGPQLKLAVRQSLVILKGGSIAEHPVAIRFIVLTVLVVGRIAFGARARLRGAT